MKHVRLESLMLRLHHKIACLALGFFLVHARRDRPSPDSLETYISSIVSAVHWRTGFAYDTYSGRTQFAGAGIDGGNAFRIRQWAALLRPTSEDKLYPPDNVHLINCYDQAAAVWIGVSLALEDSPDAYDLVRCFGEPFGFLNATNLVDWRGPTNSSFFSGDTNKQLVKDATSSSRTAFWNHALLKFKAHVLDATCGPHTGDGTLAKYLENFIDLQPGIPSSKNNKSWDNHINGEHGLHASIKELLDNLERIEKEEPLRKDDYARDKCLEVLNRYVRELNQVILVGGSTLDFIIHASGESKSKGVTGIYGFSSSTNAPIDLIASKRWLKWIGITPPDAKSHPDISRNRLISIPKLNDFQTHLPLAREDIPGPKRDLVIIDFSPDFCHFSWKSVGSDGVSVSIDI
ncbi:solute/sodium symporter, SSS family [Ceratobasidium sp. AG-Ba]|nr:solute/sodium symporter, SSS family [Ceratobasidium sp. AG-Ba]QRW09729.1 solute/sodium symporter, SSS family [Ceratobasidium sp. AG-Ba]